MTVHVGVPRGVTVPALKRDDLQLKVHELRRALQLHPSRRPTRSVLAASVVDAASWAPTDAASRALMAAAVQQRLTTAGRLRATIDAAGQIRRRSLLLETVADIEGGSHSLPELEWMRLLRRHRLPLPGRQCQVRRRTGSYYLDALWEDYRLAAEIDGVQHLRLLDRDHDDRRRNELAAADIALLQFSSYAVRHQPREVAVAVERALRARGWPGARAGRQATAG